MLTPQFPWWPGHGSDQCMHYILLFTYGWAHRLSLRPNIMYHTIANDLKPLLLGNVQEFLCHTDSERTRETKRIFCLLEWKCQFPVPSGTACTAWKISRFLQTVVSEMISTYFCNNSLILFEEFFVYARVEHVVMFSVVIWELSVLYFAPLKKIKVHVLFLTDFQ